MPDTDALIREMAQSHGRDNLSDQELGTIRTELSNGYIDDVLDGRYTQENNNAKKE